MSLTYQYLVLANIALKTVKHCVPWELISVLEQVRCAILPLYID